MLSTRLFHGMNTSMNMTGKHTAAVVDVYVVCADITVDSMDNRKFVGHSLSDVAISLVV